MLVWSVVLRRVSRKEPKKRRIVSRVVSSLRRRVHRANALSEAVASGIVRIANEDSETNLADLFMKLLTEERRNFLIDKFMY
jgi:hypothetical protein